MVWLAVSFMGLADQAAYAGFMANTYLDLGVTYATYAKTLWHDASETSQSAIMEGYWGGGIAEKDGNGAVRGMCNTMLTYAVLVHAMDDNLLSDDQKTRLATAGLTREELLKYIHANLRHVTRHHKATLGAPEPTWGNSWQSPLWLGAAGTAVMLVWDDLKPEELAAFRVIAASEADRIAATPPPDYKPGDTKAEENGWNMQAPATALAVAPDDARAKEWFAGLKRYAVNTYSVKADQTSTALVGTDRLCDIVKTANLFNDFTLENHGFFHPDYVQVSGQHLGEAWLLLGLGDRRHRTSLAKDFEPYALHHVKDVWEGVMRPLLLPNGEFAFPAGNDWTFHCSMNQGYLAWIATALRDPIALLAEQRAIQGALNRRKVSPPGRIFGDTNMQWWWEPLLCKRNTSAMLLHELRGVPESLSPRGIQQFEAGAPARTFSDAKVWMYRTPSYFVSVAWAKDPTGTFLPLASAMPQELTASREPQQLYSTVAMPGGILPAGNVVQAEELTGERGVRVVYSDNTSVTLSAKRDGVTWTSAKPFRPIYFENDKLSGGSRKMTIFANRDVVTTQVRSLSGGPPLRFGDRTTAVYVDSAFACFGPVTYTPTGKFNHLSLAVDSLQPASDTRRWKMLLPFELTASVKQGY